MEVIWIDPAIHGKGIGRALVAECVAHAGAQGCDALRVESDPGARGFYERLGATYQGEVDAPVRGQPRTLPVLSLPVPLKGAARDRALQKVWPELRGINSKEELSAPPSPRSRTGRAT